MLSDQAYLSMVSWCMDMRFQHLTVANDLPSERTFVAVAEWQLLLFWQGGRQC